MHFIILGILTACMMSEQFWNISSEASTWFESFVIEGSRTHRSSDSACLHAPAAVLCGTWATLRWCTGKWQGRLGIKRLMAMTGPPTHSVWQISVVLYVRRELYEIITFADLTFRLFSVANVSLYMAFGDDSMKSMLYCLTATSVLQVLFHTEVGF